MLTENKFMRYLLYAIGEIILVVIGILIAIQLNTFKENKQLENVKQEYYQQLLIDLEKDTENVNANINFLKKNIALYESFEKNFNSSDLKPPEIQKELDKLNLFTKTLIFNTNTLETLKNTGDIKLIPTSLRNKLIELNRYQSYLGEIYKRDFTIYLENTFKIAISNYSSIEAKPKLMKYLNKYLNIEKEKAKSITEFLTLYKFKYFLEVRTIQQYDNLLNDIEAIRSSIQLQINIQ